MVIPDLLTYLLGNLYACQETTVGTTDWFKIGKGVDKGVYCHPAYLTYMQSTSCKMLDWMKYKVESTSPGEISKTSDMYPYGRKRRGTKEPLDEGERGE